MNKIKSVLFSAGISLALVFTFGCSSSSDDEGGGSGGNSSLSSSGNGGSNSGKNSSSSSSNGGSSSGGNSSSSFVNNGKECDAIFNPDNKFCYDGVVYDKCGGKIYNPPTQGCLADKIEDKCGSSVYNQTTQGCCGSSVYSQTTQFCYEGSIYDKCLIGYELDYNNRYPIEKPIYNSYNPLTQGCVNYKIVDGKCESGWYDQTAQFCYEGSIYTKCDGMVYSPTTHICQNGVATPAKCDGESYNPVTQVCFNNKIENVPIGWVFGNPQIVNVDANISYTIGSGSFKLISIGDGYEPDAQPTIEVSGGTIRHTNLYVDDVVPGKTYSGRYLLFSSDPSESTEVNNEEYYIVYLDDGSKYLLRFTKGGDRWYSWPKKCTYWLATEIL